MANHINRRPTRLRTFAADLEAQKNAQAGNEPTSKVAVATPVAPTTPAPVIPKTAEEKLSAAVKDSVSELSEKLKAELPPPQFTTPRAPVTPPKKIPAFHELEKSVKAIQENIVVESKQEFKLHKKKKKEKPSQPVRANIGFDTAIITDTKSDRFKLFPSMLDSIRAWFKKLAAERKRKSIPKYTVADADRRKGVIQRATSKTGTIFSADNETLREQIRLRQLQTEAEAAKKAEIDEAETIWSPFTETGFSLLKAPTITPIETKNVVVSYSTPSPISAIPTTPKTAVPAAEPVEIQSEESAPSTTNESSSADMEPDDFADERWNSTPETEPTESYTPPTTAPTHQPPELVSSTKESTAVPARGIFSAFDTNTLTVVLLITLICIVAVIFATRVIMIKIEESRTTEATTVSSSLPILNTEQIIDIALNAQNLHLIPSLLTTAVASSSATGLTEYALISGAGSEISPSYLFELLQFNTMPILRQSLTSVHFASVERSDPAIVIDFTSIDAVRGGLLNWESTMMNDFGVLFEIPATTPLAFTDEKIATHDVRVLRHEGETILVYGIIDSNTAIIAKSTEDFTEIISHGITQ
ncbi:MAG: hypothetical protein RL097_558 [Candidatus Parcubacteria bacterium]|jgi:hypothetical protein